MHCWQHMLLMGWQKSTSALDLERMPVTPSLRSRAGSEPLRFAQGKLRERPGSLDEEILRFAQDDSRALRMTARTPLQSAHGKPSLQRSIDLGRTLCLAPMPVLSKQIEENLLLWMLSNHLLVEFYSKSWPLREREVSFYYAGISRCGRFYPILSKVVKVFLNLEVGCGGAKWSAAAVETGPPTLCGATSI